jgi:hypothetical protein
MIAGVALGKWEFRGAGEISILDTHMFPARIHRSAPHIPEIFIAGHASARVTSVVGLARFGGEWGPIYCGSLRINKAGKEADDIHLCQ